MNQARQVTVDRIARAFRPTRRVESREEEAAVSVFVYDEDGDVLRGIQLVVRDESYPAGLSDDAARVAAEAIDDAFACAREDRPMDPDRYAALAGVLAPHRLDGT